MSRFFRRTHHKGGGTLYSDLGDRALEPWQLVLIASLGVELVNGAAVVLWGALTIPKYNSNAPKVGVRCPETETENESLL